MNDCVFLDTNVLVYLFDADAPQKQARARAILEMAAIARRVLLSTQVLQEFYVSVTRKLAQPLGPSAAYRAVEDLTAFSIVQIDTLLVLTAIQRHQKEHISFWDALIVEAALAGGATMLYTEDLQHGRIIEGLKVENPFLVG